MQNKVFKNATWIIICKVIQSILALLINMLTARYLGPSNFGTISYAASLVTFVVPIMQLGLNSILVQEIIHNPQKEGEVLGTALTMSVTSSLFCIIGVVSFSFVANYNEKETIIVCALYSVILVFQAVDIIQYWFQAKLLSKFTSLSMLCSYLLVASYKVFLLLSHKSIYWFSISNALDYMLIAFSLVVIYYKLGGQKLSFSFSLAKYMFNRGKHFIVSSLMITIFSQTDKIMIKLLLNETITGYYSAAVACALLSNFVFAAIIDSVRPSIIEAHIKNTKIYEERIIQLYSLIIYLSLVQSILMTLFAKFIVLVLYGNDYLDSVILLRLVVWYTTFSYIGSVRSIWILTQEKQKYLWIINLSGALTNVFLNLILIPYFGAIGAAIASVFTQFFTNVLIGYIIKPISDNNRLLIKSLNPKYLLTLSMNLLSKKKSE